MLYRLLISEYVCLGFFSLVSRNVWYKIKNVNIKVSGIAIQDNYEVLHQNKEVIEQIR